MLVVLKVITLLFLLFSTSNGDISPSVGSLGGGTRVTISGSGFSEDSYESSNGNIVRLTTNNPTETLPCEAVSYSSNSEQIVCVTGNSGRSKLILFFEI